MLFEPSQAALQEGGGVFLAFAGEQLRERQARAVVDGERYSQPRPRPTARQLLWPVRSPVMQRPMPSMRPAIEGRQTAKATAPEHLADRGDGAAEPAWLGEAAPEPEADLLAEAAPFAEPEAPGAAADDELIADAAPAARLAGRSVLRTEQEAPRQGSVADGFTDFRPVEAPQPTMAAAGNDLIDALPSLLPVFADLANTVDRPFGTMPEVMPPPPLRPILPPELQDEGPRPGLLARMLGRK